MTCSKQVGPAGFLDQIPGPDGCRKRGGIQYKFLISDLGIPSCLRWGWGFWGSIIKFHYQESYLKNIEKLQIINQGVGEFPDELFELSNLRVLDLSGSYFEQLPQSIENLYQLEVLDLGNSNIDTFPNAICNIKSLKKLYLGGTKISSLPNCIGYLENLEILDLKYLKKLFYLTKML